MRPDGIDFSELLRSPLDPEPDESESSTPQWPMVAALVLGVIAGWVLAAGLSGDDAESNNVAPPVTTMTGDQGTAVEASPFPDDYVAIAPDVAVRPEEPMRVGDRVLVPFTMLVRRGADPETVPRPLGGRWELVRSNGVLASAGTVYDPLRPSVFSVEFPAPVAFAESIALVERWDPEPVAAAIDLPFTGLPYVNEEPIVIDLGGGVALTVTRLELGNFQARARWRLDGAPLGIVSIGVRLFNPDGSVLGDYQSGAAESLDPERGAGFIDYIWGPGFGVDQNDASTFTLTADVQLGRPVATDVSVPLTD